MSIATAMLHGAIPATAWAGDPTARPLRLILLQVPCGEGFVFARAPGRESACLVNPTDLVQYRDNTFGVNAFGLVVGTYGLPDEDPCEPPEATDVLIPHAFAWLPRDPSSDLGLPSGLPVQEVIDLHVPASLEADLSVANDVTESGGLIVGGAGDDCIADFHAYVWDLTSATVSGGVVTAIDATDLHDDLEYTDGTYTFPPGPWSVGHGAYQPLGETDYTLVGSFVKNCPDTTAGDDHSNGFVVDSSEYPSVIRRLGPEFEVSWQAEAFDIGVDPDSEGSLMAVGLTEGTLVENPEDECDKAFFPLPCNRANFKGTMWTPPWDDDAEVPQADDGRRYDFQDFITVPFEVSPPTGYINRAINTAGEIAGYGWHNEFGLSSQCRTRGAFWWWDSPTWQVADLDEDFVAVNSLNEDDVSSRAEALSVIGQQDYLLVGGEDQNEEPYGHALVWCGYADDWIRHDLNGSDFNDPMVRYDGFDESAGAQTTYDLPSNWRLTFVHDVSVTGVLVVTLEVTFNPGMESSFLVDYPAVLTLAEDVNGDLIVNGVDMSAVLGAWGTCNCKFDIAGEDGIVDGADYGAVIGAWTGDETVDLHTRFSCYQPEERRQEDMQVAIDAAIESYLGLEPVEFAAWGAAASVEALESAVTAIRVIAGLE